MKLDHSTLRVFQKRKDAFNIRRYDTYYFVFGRGNKYKFYRPTIDFGNNGLYNLLISLEKQLEKDGVYGLPRVHTKEDLEVRFGPEVTHLVFLDEEEYLWE